jgi:hypothetical protein
VALKPNFELTLCLKDATDPANKVDAENVTTTLTFNSQDLAEITNTSGCVVFRSTAGMDFSAGSLVSIAIIDYSQELQAMTITPTLGAGSSQTIT